MKYLLESHEYLNLISTEEMKSIEIGDKLILKDGREVKVNSIPAKDNPKYGKSVIVTPKYGKSNITINREDIHSILK